MGQGGLSKALIIVSKAKGWDPTVIPARGDQPAESIANFDKAPEIYTNQAGTGTLPPGTGEQSEVGFMAAPDFASPEIRTNQVHRTSGANPNAGKDGF